MTGNWHCSRAETLYDGIICPEGHYRVKKSEFLNQCNDIGRPCPEGYTCYCKPCIKAFEVDVVQWSSFAEFEEEGGGSLSQHKGCGKMVMCGSVEQTRKGIFRAYDNREREDVTLSAIMHVGQETYDLPVTQVANESYVYEFTYSDNYVGVGILEVYVDGVQIPESPFRVQVIDRDCEIDFPGKGKVPVRIANLAAVWVPCMTESGTCVCGTTTYEINGQCVDKSIFAVSGSVAGVMLLAFITFMVVRYRTRKNDEAWQVSIDELHFDDPIEVIGQGSFGVVLLAEYRGTRVAIKRAVKVKQKKGSRNASGTGRSASGTQPDMGSSIPSVPSCDEAASSDEENHDVENQVQKCDESRGSSRTGSHKGSRNGSRSGGGRTGSRSKSDNYFSLRFLHDEYGQSTVNLFGCCGKKKKGYRARFRDSILGESLSASLRSKTLKARLCPWFDEQTIRENEFLTEMRVLARLRHPCITTVMGAVVTTTHDPMLVMEYMDYGSLHDLLNNETMLLSGEIILQMMRDVSNLNHGVAQGLRYLHSAKPQILHGDLKARNILIDSRFRAKLCDFGMSTKSGNNISGTPFWMAPEYLRGDEEYNAACDIYSIGIILFEIYSRKSPYEGEDFRDVLRKVCNRRINKRPGVPTNMPQKMADLMKRCWSHDVTYRPQAKDLDVGLMDLSPQEAEPVLEEDSKLKKNTKDMLYEIFPKHIADALKKGDKVEPEQHDLVTVVFSDIVHFTDLSHELTPMKVSQMLDRLYLAFDQIAKKHKVFKVETIGGAHAYMGVTNLEGNMDDCHTKNVAAFAVDLINEAGKILIDEEEPGKGHVNIRVGFHCGPVVSNVIGSLNPRYGLFGDTVNTASRMESNSKPNRILCSERAYNLLVEQDPEMPVKKRGRVAVKGKGDMNVYWVGDNLIEIGKLGGPVLKDEKVVAFEGVADSSHNGEDFQEPTGVDEKLWRREMQTKLHHLDSGPKDMEDVVECAPPKHEKKKDVHRQVSNQGEKKNEVFKVKRTAAGSW
eukprot:scaffold2204_cov166-Amphora_coffeaeformis.AAC.6